MNKDKLATIAGAIAAVASMAPQFGLDFGHIGSVTGMGAISATAIMFLGWITNKGQK